MPPVNGTSKQRGSFLWWLPAPPKSPDYSTSEKVTLRAYERGAASSGWVRETLALLRTDGRVYRDFQAALRRLAPCHPTEGA